MYKPLESKIKNYIDKNELPKNTENNINIITKLNYLIDYELIDSFKNILNEPKADFLSFVMIKVKSYLVSEYNQKSFDGEMLKYLLKHSKERLDRKYENHLENLSFAWENFQLLKQNKKSINEIESCYLKDFEYHCSATFEYAIHNCKRREKIFGKFIKVIDKSSNNKNLVKYVICENCKKCYFIDHFQNYCEKCKVNYYCCELSDDQKDILPATLKTPHCEPVVNEKLFCHFCKGVLNLNVKTKQIKCSKCRFISSPYNMECICHNCSEKFKSDVIAYNKSEVNYIKKVINYALLIKKHARPIKLPCCPDIDVKTTYFYHKKECKGIIYFAEFHKRLIIICEKCKAVNNFGKFIWTCPGCSLRFKDMKWQENEIRLRKELFNRNVIQINIDIDLDNDDEISENRKNIRKMDKNDFVKTIQIRTKSKNKSNLHDILRKRTNFISEKNKTEIKNFAPHRYLRENKDLSTEGSSRNNPNINNYEGYSDNQLYEEIMRIKRNLDPANTINKKDQNISKKKSKSKSKKNSLNKDNDDDLSSEIKNNKKRYIFEKLIRRQFISSNNIESNNNLVTEKNDSEKDIQENLQIEEKRPQKFEQKEKSEKNEKKKENESITNSNIKRKFVQKMRNSQSNVDIKRGHIKDRGKWK